MAQTHNIEDVLSSIRRLVANDAPVAERRSTEVPTLVLAEAQRVTEPEDPFQMIRAMAQQERDGRDAVEVTDALSEDVSEITRDLDATEEEAGNETPRSEAEFDAVAQSVPEGAHTSEAAIVAERDVGDKAGIWEDFATVASKPPGDDAEDNDFEAAGEQSGSDGLVAPQPVVAAPVLPPRAGESDRVIALSDLSGAVADDQALRDLIAEIVRRELAGELGERITRNVRKLVRREIRQILASDDND